MRGGHTRRVCARGMITTADEVKRKHVRLPHALSIAVWKSLDTFGAQVEQWVKSGAGVRFKPRSGKLQDSVGHEVQERWGEHRLKFTASAPYASFVERGTKAHPIHPKRPGGMLRFYWEKLGKWVSLKRVNHPGTPAYRFLIDNIHRARQQFATHIKAAGESLASRF